MGLILQALYESKDWTVETNCIVKAAGPAADFLYEGRFSEISASGDLHDIEVLTGKASLEPYLTMAKEILAKYSAQLKCIETAMHESLERVEERILGVGFFPNNGVGALLLDEVELMECLEDGWRATSIDHQTVT